MTSHYLNQWCLLYWPWCIYASLCLNRVKLHNNIVTDSSWLSNTFGVWIELSFCKLLWFTGKFSPWDPVTLIYFMLLIDITSWYKNIDRSGTIFILTCAWHSPRAKRHPPFFLFHWLSKISLIFINFELFQEKTFLKSTCLTGHFTCPGQSVSEICWALGPSHSVETKIFACPHHNSRQIAFSCFEIWQNCCRDYIVGRIHHKGIFQ